jgi:hypothetical protein
VKIIHDDPRIANNDDLQTFVLYIRAALASVALPLGKGLKPLRESSPCQDL